MKKIILAVFALALAVMTVVSAPVQLAAGSKVRYISDIVLAYGEEEKQAAINAGYTNIAGNVNQGNSVEVYLCYKCTYD